MFSFTLVVSILFGLLAVFFINKSFAKSVKQAQNNVIFSLPYSTFVIDAQQRIVFFNTVVAKMTSLESQKAIGQPIDTVFPLFREESPVPFSTYSQRSQESFSEKQPLSFKKADGTVIQIAITVAPFTLGIQGHGFLITLHDTLQEQQFEEMKVDFVSMAAHELRTPLTAIRGYVSLLQMHYATQLEPAAKQLLTRLIISTTNLTNLIDNLLSVSRIERNNLTIEAKPIDIGIIVKDIYDSFLQQAQTRNQNFVLNIPEHIPQVMADPFRIGQVFINLISNALNYTSEGGSVTITIAVKNNFLEISIRDTGEGIPQEALSKLFTKFFRVSGSLEQGSKGTGLGLYITKSIIEMHKGKIWVESALGKGSTFTFALPTATPEEINKRLQNNSNLFLTVKDGQGIIIRK